MESSQSQNQSQRALRPSPLLHPARAAIIDLFNTYLGPTSRQRIDDTSRDLPNKMQKRITAPFKDLPPPNEQFLLDFENLQSHISDSEHLHAVTESVITSFVLQCSSHAPQSDFIFFSIQRLCSVGYVKWDTLLPSLLNMVASAETSVGQGNNSMIGGTSSSAYVLLPSSSPAASTFQASTPPSPMPSMHVIGSPTQSTNTNDQSTSVAFTSTKPSESHTSMRINQPGRGTAIGYLRQFSCKIILAGLETSLKPVTCAEVFLHMMRWLVNWEQRQQSSDDVEDAKPWKHDGTVHEWMHMCLDVVWTLVDEKRCRIPFYEFIRSGLQFIDNLPDNEALFSIILEIHRRRDMVATHMQMLDQHLHCPSFGTHRLLTQTFPTNIPGEPVTNTRYPPITYPSVLGEPLHGEDLVTGIPRGSLDWERALRCLRHALRTAPSPDWWRRVLLVASCYKSHSQQSSIVGAVFSPEMVCEAIIDRTIELLKLTNSDTHCWQEWIQFADVFFFLTKSGSLDFIDFVHKLASQISTGAQQILRSNHVTWLLAQIIRIEIVMNTLSSDPKKVETIKTIISFHKEDKSPDSTNTSAQAILLDFISSSQTLRIWSFNSSIREHLNSDQLQKGKQIDEWWRQVTKGDRDMDFMNLDEKSMGMFWVLSFTMAQPACEAIIHWLTSSGVQDAVGNNAQSSDRMMIMRETSPLPIPLLAGLSINMSTKLAFQLEDAIFLGQVVPSIAMVETYIRLLLIAPHALFRPHFTNLTQRSPSILSKNGVSLLLLEILNYRLLSLYRYNGKSKALLYDVTKIISMIKGKRGDHRIFRLAENLCMNLILTIRDFFMVKKELKGPSDFTETLNRITLISLSITIKTRGIAEVDHLLFLQPLLEQVMAASQHTWSEKTVRYFPQLVREFLAGRTDKRGQSIQAWQQAETTVINQCRNLLSPSADPTYVLTYLSHSFPQHRQYLCAGAWILMNGHPESINSMNLGRVLREFSPEEVTSNIYTMIDVLLHHIQIQLQHGHIAQDLLSKAIASLVHLIWTHELLPLDILLLALIDRDDDPYALRIVINMLDRPEFQQRINMFCSNRVSPEHWQNNQPPKRIDLQKALGNHLSWKEKYPPFFDDIAVRLLPVVPLIIYRLIENDATDVADLVLGKYSHFLSFHPLRFTFVRDILAYFYGHLPGKLIVRIIRVLDLSKIPFSDSFPQHVGSANASMCPPPDYFANLLFGLVNNVIPALNNKSNLADPSMNYGRGGANKNQASSQSGTINNLDGQKTFYQNQDPGTYTQLILETAVIEILSLPSTVSQSVISLLQIVVHVQPTLLQSSSGQGITSVIGQSSGLPTSPSGGSTESMNTNRSAPSTTGINSANFISKSGYSCQQLSCLMIQACGLLLAQLPQEFHMQLYTEASQIIKDSWWLVDGKRTCKELDSAVGYALCDPTWASQDNTSTAIGNIVALLHSFFSNLPQEWLESTQTIIKHLRPVTSVAMLRIVFRIMGPLLPRLAFARPLFMKTLALLFNAMADVFGKNTPPSISADVSEIMDIIDFLHHIVMYEGQGGPVQSTSKPKVESLTLCTRVMDLLRPDVQHLLTHLRTDANSSIYAATHPKLIPQNPT